MSTPAALYARVSSDRQREQETIASQTAALQAYAAAHNYLVPREWVFEDDGYSGTTLARPGLEALRDLAASGQIVAALVYAPDRLSRKYAYQILLTEELARRGVSVVYLKAPAGDTPEDRLLVQVQGMIAEYERAQIVERTRRGKRHKAQCGVVNALSGAPYGYRYVKKTDHANAVYAVEETEAAVVRQVFAAYTQDGVSLREITRRLTAGQVPTRKRSRWDPSTIYKLLRNPAYAGRACFGKTGVGPRQQIQRRRQGGRRPLGDTANHDRPRTEWLEIPVPPLISEAIFAVAQERLEDNAHFARRRTKTPTLLQGLLVCQQCGYSLYRRRRYYRCWGSDGYRHRHGPVCTNRPMRQDQLDALVWDEVIRLLDDPTLVQAELDRRLEAARQADPCRQHVEDLTRQQIRLAHSIERLVTAYQQDLVTLDDLRDRMPALRKQQQALAAARESLELASADQARYLRLSETLTEFRATLRARSDTLDVSQRQQIVRLVVKEIRVGLDTLTICHSLPIATPGHDPDDRGGSSPNEGGPGPGSPNWLLCVRSQAARLRPGQGGDRRNRTRGRGCTAGRIHGSADDAGHHHAGHDPRHVSVHGAGAARGKRRGCTDRHLLVRLRAVRDGDRKESVRRQEPREPDQRDHVVGAAADLDRPARRAARTRSHRQHVPRQRSGRSLAVRARPAARVEVDWRRRREAGDICRGDGRNAAADARAVAGAHGAIRGDDHRACGRRRLSLSRDERAISRSIHCGAAGQNRVRPRDSQHGCGVEQRHRVARRPKTSADAERCIREDDAVGAIAGFGDRPAFTGHRRCESAVLVARQPQPGLLRAGQAEED